MSPSLSQIDGFIRIMLVMVALALFFPVLGTNDDPLRLSIVTVIGASPAFFLYGATFSREKTTKGARSWRLHLFVQSCTFILFSPIDAVILFVCKSFIPAELLLGVFYLCALLSTVSSSVTMAVMAKGNAPVAILNMTISGLIDIIATPPLMSSMIRASGVDLLMSKALLGVAEQLLLSFVLGQLPRLMLGGFINKHKAIINKADCAMILLIIFNSFADSTHVGVWSKYPWETITAMAVMNSALLFVVPGVITWLSRRVGFNLADEITAVFCGPRKSLTNGMSIGKILFVGSSTLGLTILPLVIYYQLQLIVYSAPVCRCVGHVAHIENSPVTPVSCMA